MFAWVVRARVCLTYWSALAVAHAQFFTVLWHDVSHVILRTRLPLFSRATLKRLGEPGDEAIFLSALRCTVIAPL